MKLLLPFLLFSLVFVLVYSSEGASEGTPGFLDSKAIQQGKSEEKPEAKIPETKTDRNTTDEKPDKNNDPLALESNKTKSETKETTNATAANASNTTTPENEKEKIERLRVEARDNLEQLIVFLKTLHESTFKGDWFTNST